MLCYIYILYVNSCPYVEVQTFTVSLNIFLFQILMDLFQDRNQTLSLYTRLAFFKGSVFGQEVCVRGGGGETIEPGRRAG